MKEKEKIVRKTLDLLMENVENFEDLLNLKFTIQDYLDEGYKVFDYDIKYKRLVIDFYEKKRVEEIKKREKLMISGKN